MSFPIRIFLFTASDDRIDSSAGWSIHASSLNIPGQI